VQRLDLAAGLRVVSEDHDGRGPGLDAYRMSSRQVSPAVSVRLPSTSPRRCTPTM
jgi:hypothetical protein